MIKCLNFRFAQFDSAKETFEVISDYESLLGLFICHLNPSAMRRLAQKLEEDGADPELRRYCERILRVRSSGWTQGIFANFAAESMVPKGPEWGGGNWEIKTPTNLKAIPQWELAGEVLPYMRTDDGAIPSIIADHIGVYLGSIKGRGNIVEVREDSLVKALVPPAGGENKANALSMVSSTSNKPKGASDGDSKGESLMGLETLTKKFPDSTAKADEQAKAEEEFKKSFATADGSSSDEEGVSKTKKLHIRIREKPIASTTVDVNKIKEATFKLSEGLGLPISRSKSMLSGPQDLSQILSQPSASSASTSAPAVSAPVDPFATVSFTQPANLSQPTSTATGTGVTARPIPEDFFQNTIPSLQVAAQLRPPGSYISALNPASQGVQGNNAAANYAQASQQPDVGVPPQAAQQPVSMEQIGLPDGGVPPQASAQTGNGALPQAPAVRVPLSTQPLDLSVLGVADSGKPLPRPTSPPSSVRPGQVKSKLSRSAYISVIKTSTFCFFDNCCGSLMPGAPWCHCLCMLQDRSCPPRTKSTFRCFILF